MIFSDINLCSSRVFCRYIHRAGHVPLKKERVPSSKKKKERVPRSKFLFLKRNLERLHSKFQVPFAYISLFTYIFYIYRENSHIKCSKASNKRDHELHRYFGFNKMNIFGFNQNFMCPVSQ